MSVGEPLAGLVTSKDTSAFRREAGLSVKRQELWSVTPATDGLKVPEALLSTSVFYQATKTCM